MRLTSLKRVLRHALIIVVTALVVTGCGLGMTSQDRLDRGEQAYQDGDFRAAIIDAKVVLQDEPDNVAARLLLGRASIEAGDATTAEFQFRRAIDLGTDPGDVIVDLGRALLVQQKYSDVIAEIDPALAEDDAAQIAMLQIRAGAFLGLGQPVTARDLFTQLLDVEPDNQDALLGIVRSYINEGNLLQARQSLDHVIETSGGNAPAWVMSGFLSLRMQDARRAEADFKRAAEIARSGGDQATEMNALHGLADALFAQQRAEDVRPISARMAELSTEDTRTILVSALLAREDENWSEAQQQLQEILRRNPNYRPAQVLLGAVHKESGNLAQAEMYLSAAVAAQPDDAQARRLLAETRVALGQSNAAREVLRPLVDDTSVDADAASLSTAAAASLQLGEADEAIEFLQRGLATNPGDVGLQLQLASAYLSSGKPDLAQDILTDLSELPTEANEFLRDSLLVFAEMARGDQTQGLERAKALVARWPARPEAHVLAGSVEMADGDYAAARKSFVSASELAPGSPGPIRNLASLDEAEGQLESARRRYELLLEMQPADSQSMVSLARLAGKREQPDEARKWLEKARAADNNAVQPRRLLGSYYIATRQFAEAEAVAKEAIALKPGDANLQNILGLAQLSQQNYRDAESSFERAISIDDTQDAYRLNLARAQFRGGNTGAAISTLEADEERTMEHTPSALALTYLELQSGRVEEAKKIASRLRDLNPDESMTHAMYGEVLAKTGDLIGASSAYDAALAIDRNEQFTIRAYRIRNQAGLDNAVEPLVEFLAERPLNHNMRMFLANAYESLGERGSATAQYEEVLLTEPDNVVAINNLAWNYFVLGDPRAEETARAAHSLQPELGPVLDTLGWILVNKGKLGEGVVLLRKAVQEAGDRPELKYHLAVALAETGEADEARTLLQEILADNNQFESRQQAEELLATF